MIFPEETPGNPDFLFNPTSLQVGQIIKNLKKEILEEQVLRDISNVKNFIFELTQNCNFRCEYCAYSGIYNPNRTHNSKKMSIETARKAIDFCFSILKSDMRTRRRGGKTIFSFYGGESLLEPDVLFTAVEYIKKKFGKTIDIDFNITTNGYLLGPTIARRFVEEDFSIDISLDGPKEEHDRFRKTASGKDSFDRIIENINYIRSISEDFARERLRFFITLHPYHDLSKIEAFFLQNKDLFRQDNVVINFVNIDGLDEKTRNEWIGARRKQLDAIYDKLKKGEWFYKYFFYPRFSEVIKDEETRLLRENSAFTATCPPGGTRLFIDVDGRLHMCEKIPGNYSIGDIEKGFDIPRIKEILNLWRTEILKAECWNCECWYLCNFCIALNSKNGKITIEKKECEELRESIKKMLPNYLTILENEGKNNEEKSINHSCLTINDFMDRL